MNRRQFLQSTAAFAASSAFGNQLVSAVATPKGNAEHCIFIWLGGGMGQVDTLDPKDLGDNKASPKKPGSLYASIDTAVKGVRLSEHFKNTAPLLERMTIVRTVNHHVIDEHAFATNLVHTGRMISGNVI